MDDALVRHDWGQRLTLCLLSLLILGALIVPGNEAAGRLPGPDITLALMIAWLMRSPAAVPAILVVAITLLFDMVTMRPPGLWTALVLIATETIRNRESLWQEMTFLMEWAIVSAILTAIFVLYAGLLALFFVDQPPFGLTLVRLVATVLVYPVIVAISGPVFKIRRRRAGSDR